MKKLLFTHVIVLLTLLFPKSVIAYNHSEVAPSGQTLYYTIATSGAIVVYPGTGILNMWTGFEKPTGTLVIPDSILYNGVKYPVVSIGQFAFNRCNGLTSVVLPITVKTLGDNAFSKCNNLSSISLPDSLRSIGHSVFEYDSNLTQVNLPVSLDSVGYSAFWGTGLTHLAIPAGVSFIGSSIVAYCPLLENIIIDENNPYYDSRYSCNAIIESASNTLISGCKNSVIPNDIVKIEFSAFAGCAGMTYINIPECVEEIAHYAFSDCSNLSSISLPNGLKKIEDYTFAASGLETINIPDSVWYIGEHAFSECIHLETINFGSKINWIDELAFYGCNSLQSVIIPASVSIIMPAIFGGCNNLQSIVVDEDNERYSSRNGCNAIFDGNTLWQACSTTIIPSGVNRIGWGAYLGFTNIDTVIIPEGVEEIDREAFEDCTNLTYVQFPNSVSLIKDLVFYRCQSLNEVSIGSGIQQIGRAVFDSTNCRALHIGASVPPTIDSTTLHGLHPEATIYVPCGAGATYRDASYWNDFIIEEENCNRIDNTEFENVKIQVNNGCIVVDGYSDNLVKVFDMTGREVYNKDLANGVYLVKVDNFAAQKVIVSR